MGVSEDYKKFIQELFAGFAPVTIRNMLGGGGVFNDGVMFAIIADETLYLKADDTNRAAFEAEGMGPFTYQAKDRVSTMSYWEVPERLYDDPEEFADWARSAYAVSFKNKKKKR
ncbi:MAG: TfoX/Sxy family protein [Hyphomicrobiales bacterium]|nr:TfoX/Sxy family protein [Hyphomicrobiales bacterium]